MGEPGSTEGLSPEEAAAKAVSDLLHDDNVQEQVKKFSDKFDEGNGKDRGCGITPSGILFGLKEFPKSQGSHNFFAFAQKVSPESEEEPILLTNVGRFVTVRGDGMVSFGDRRLQELAQKTEAELDSLFADTPAWKTVINLYKLTGGFVAPQRMFPPFKPVTVGGETLFPIRR